MSLLNKLRTLKENYSTGGLLFDVLIANLSLRGDGGEDLEDGDESLDVLGLGELLLGGLDVLLEEGDVLLGKCALDDLLILLDEGGSFNFVSDQVVGLGEDGNGFVVVCNDFLEFGLLFSSGSVKLVKFLLVS